MATSRLVSPGGSIGRAQAVGALIPVVFGLVFIEANCGQLERDWQAAARAVGALLAVALIIGIVRVRRRSAAGSGHAAAGGPSFGRGYWVIVAIEAVALVAGLIVISKALGLHDLSVPWIALVVGVHFFGLGRIWQAGRMYVLGAVVALLGVAGFALHASGDPDAAVALVSGILSGAALYLSVAWWLLFRPARP